MAYTKNSTFIINNYTSKYTSVYIRFSNTYIYRR